MTCGDLFAGIGGMSLGLERAGFTVRWQVECESYCENILARHWPLVPRRRDVRLAGAANLNRVDLIAGGFPCQDVSCAGRGVGLSGFRSGLWREFARIVRELGPRWVLVENVPALRRRGADTVLGDLEAAGYTCKALVVGAHHVGAPHRRNRLWIVGRLADDPRHGGEATPLASGQGDEGGAVVAGGSSRMADASGDLLRQQPRRGSGPGGAEAGEPAAARGMANGDGAGRTPERGGGLLDGERAALWNDADRCDRTGLADGDATRLEGRRVPGCERADQWPARPGCPPHDWEQPRTVESPLGRRTHGISARLARTRWRRELMALGNAVVPQVVEVIGRAILAVEAALADPEPLQLSSLIL